MSENFDALGYYEVLEVTPYASLSQIKTQYYDRAKFWHPDHNENPKALEIFQKISVAYNILKEQKTRLKYDLLSIIYSNNDFPEINSLKIYKNQKGRDDIALRVLKQKKIQDLFEIPSGTWESKDGDETILECNCILNNKVCKLKVSHVKDKYNDFIEH